MSDYYDSDYEQESLKERVHDYKKSIIEFHLVQKLFEDEIPRVSQLTREERVIFTIDKYEDYLFKLRGARPRVFKKELLGTVDEFKTICDAFCIGWQLLPDCWTGLMMMIDILAEDMPTEDIRRLDTKTLEILKEITEWKIWIHNPYFAPQLIRQANCILVRFSRGCSFAQTKMDSLVRGPAGLVPLFGALLGRSSRENQVVQPTFRNCDGPKCSAVETEKVKFKVCGRCKKVFYCSKKCQTKAWRTGHKNICAL